MGYIIYDPMHLIGSHSGHPNIDIHQDGMAIYDYSNSII